MILPRLFPRNFIFDAEANNSAWAEVRHVIATKFQQSGPKFGKAEVGRLNWTLAILMKDSRTLTPGPDAAGATADSDGVLASNLIREARAATTECRPLLIIHQKRRLV